MAPLGLAILVFLVCPFAHGDPETVDGLYLTKKSAPASVPKRIKSSPAVGPPPALAPVSFPNEPSRNGAGSDGRFPQAHLGGVAGRGGRGPLPLGSNTAPRAFASYLTPPERGLDWYRRHYEQNRLRKTHHPQQERKQQQQLGQEQHQPPKKQQPVPTWGGLSTQLPPLIKWSPHPTKPKIHFPGFTTHPSLKNDNDHPKGKIKTPSFISEATTKPTEHVQETDVSLTSSTGGPTVSPSTERPLAVHPSSAKSTTKDSTTPKQERVIEAPEKKVGQAVDARPRVEYLKSSSGDVDGFSGSDGRKSLAGILVGVVFVAAFLAVALGLAVGRLLRPDAGHGGTGGCEDGVGQMFPGPMRSPDDDERTPPELRGYGGHPAFVQPGEEKGRKGRGKNNGGGGAGDNGQHFFTGQLILHEAKRLVGAARGAGAGTSSCSLAHSTPSCLLTGESAHVTTSLAAAQAAVMMPSPAEQVTDDLISPKYDEEDEEEEEEEDSDDTVYECPGLASTGEMVVANPFYLQGGDHLPVLDGAAEPKPISQSSIFHHGIKGVN